jgi:hypothetical protein
MELAHGKNRSATIWRRLDRDEVSGPRQLSPRLTDLFNTVVNDAEMKYANIKRIGEYYHSRLKTIFPSVAANPKELLNSKKSPIFQLHFAAGNPKGGRIALKIAEHILKQV